LAKNAGDLRFELERFSREAREIVENLGRPFNEAVPPPIIYHYTDAAGLLGILKSGELWFSDIFGLNDPSELRHGVSYAVNFLKEAAVGGSPEVGIFANIFEEFWTQGIEEIASFFVCCLSATDEELSQWRAYADNGRGYALGFDTDLLKLSLDDNSFPISHFSICYEDKPLRATHSSLVNKVLPLIAGSVQFGLAKDELREFLTAVGVAFSAECVASSTLFKHRAYLNEHEYRLLKLFAAGAPLPALRYRMRAHTLHRYFEFNWKAKSANALKRIVIGPSADRLASQRFVRSCLKEFHLSGGQVDVDVSDIPFKST
jgi:hypothetical protein